MGLFSRKKEQRATGEAQMEDSLLKALMGTAEVSRETALQIPTVSGGIDLIANIVASTPIKLYSERDGKAEEIRKDPRVFLLNDETGDTLNANEFWHAMVRDYFLGKGGYAYLNRSRGKIKSIHYVDERQISVMKNVDPIFKDFDIMVMGNKYKPYDFLRILRNTQDGAEGNPITKENSRLIAVAYQQLLLEQAMARRGGKKKGFLQTENNVDAESMRALKTAWADMYAQDGDGTVILNKGLKFQEASDTAAEMQLSENKKANSDEFAKIFHVSAEAIKGTGADINALAKLAAIPLMAVIQCALNRDFLLEKEKGSMYFAFDTKELLKGEINERFNAYKTALDANFMQIDEVRFAEDLEPLGLQWIKLGLNDVLYDPKTKQIYTPNTNQTSVMGESIIPLQSGKEDDTMEPRAGNFVQDPDTGLMMGSEPTGGGSSGSDGGSGSSEADEGKKESGAKSGALNEKNDPEGDRRETHAEKYYASIRNSNTKRIVKAISKNTGIEEETTNKAIQHLFMEKHELDGGAEFFASDFEIAESVQRLREGKAIEKHDTLLIMHEATEADFMRGGLSYEDAHEKANESYNYQKAVREYAEGKK